MRWLRAVSLLLALLVAAVPAFALSDKDAHVAELPSAAESMNETVALIAESLELSEDDVRGMLDLQSRFDNLLSEVSSSHDDVFSGAWSDPDSGRVFVRFVGQVPPDVEKAAKDLGLDATFLSTGVLTVSEMEEVVRAAAEVVADRGAGLVTPSLIDQRVTITIESAPGDADDPAAEVLAVLERQGPGTGPLGTMLASGRIDISIAADLSHPLGVGEHTYGGGSALDDGSFECTTGFTVNLPGGGTGVLTAAHCHGINEFRQEDGLEYSMPWWGEHAGDFGDLEVHTSTHIEPDDFYFNVGALRDVTGVLTEALINPGDIFCVFGRQSGGNCAIVQELNMCYFPDSRLACNMVRLDRWVTAGGDSGGPWYDNSKAVGVHSGRIWLIGGWYSLFTPVDAIDDVWPGMSIRS